MVRVTYLVDGSWGHDEFYSKPHEIEAVLTSSRQELLSNFNSDREGNDLANDVDVEQI